MRFAYREVRIEKVKRPIKLSLNYVLGRFCLGGNGIGAVSDRVKLQTETADGLRHNVG